MQSVIFAHIVASNIISSAGYATQMLARSLGSVRAVSKSFRDEVDKRIRVLVLESQILTKNFVFGAADDKTSLEWTPRSATALTRVLCIDPIDLLLSSQHEPDSLTTWTGFLSHRSESDCIRSSRKSTSAPAATERARALQLRERRLLDNEIASSRCRPSVTSALLPLVSQLGTEFPEEFSISCWSDA